MLGSDNKRCGIVAEALIETAGLGQPGLFLAGYVFIYGNKTKTATRLQGIPRKWESLVI